jgi:tetratricopeptide (TPR) repeat protein
LPTGTKSDENSGLYRDALLLGAAIVFCFGPLLGTPLVYDDIPSILGNRLVAGPWPGFARVFGAPYDAHAAYEPLITLGHRALFLLAGRTAWPYHLTSLLLHWACAAAFLAVARRRLKDARLALCTALAFALHPAHVEALAVSSFKTHLACGFLVILCVAVLDRFKTSLRRDASLWVIFAAALFCKETAVILIPIAAAALASRGELGRSKRLFAGWFAAAAGYAAWRLAVVPRPLASAVPAGAAAATAAKAFLWDLAHLPLPAGLCLQHDLAPVSLLSAEGLLAAALALGALAALASLARRNKESASAAAWIAAALAPFVLLWPVLDASVVTDRYLYLASAGAALLCASAMPRTWSLALLGTAAFVFAGMDIPRCALFADPLELWRATAACAPGNPRAHASLAAEEFDRRLYAEAEADFERALELKPDYWDALGDLAQTEAALGHGAEGLALARRRVEGSADAAGYLTLGSVLMNQGQFEDARLALSRANFLAPDNAAVRDRLADCDAELKRREGSKAGARPRPSPRRAESPAKAGR